MADSGNSNSGGYSATTAPAGGGTPNGWSGTEMFMGVAGVTILVIAGVIIFRSLTRQDDREGTGNAPAATTPERQVVLVQNTLPETVPVVFAAVLRTGQLQTAAGGPELAAALFGGAAMRWAGAEAEWNGRVAEMGLMPSGYSDDNDNLIVTFHARLPFGQIPANRLDMQRRLNSVADAGGLKSGDLYRRPVGIDPSRFGFKEF